MTALIVVAISQIADLVTFAATAAVYPISGEQNPVARLLYADTGIFGVELYKIALMIGMLAAVSRLRRAPDWVRVSCIGALIGIGLAGAAANLVTLAVALGR